MLDRATGRTSTEELNKRPKDHGGFRLRSLHSPEDYRACVELQREVWGDRFSEVVPATIVQVSQRIGGVAVGAFAADGSLAGFVLGLTGLEADRPVHWSHMLAVRAAMRKRGLGHRLKLHQRDVLLAKGVETVYWTFDPLVATNAHFNLNRLGATVLEYVPDMYGDIASGLHAGRGTDRLLLAWRIAAPMVAGARQVTGTSPLEQAPLVNPFPSEDAHQSIVMRLRDVPLIRIAIPADINALNGMAPGDAALWRSTTREAFLWYVAAGYKVIGFAREDDAGFYMLARAVPEDSPGSAN
jgi:predicted GNAT superfamily acetyltransferase